MSEYLVKTSYKESNAQDFNNLPRLCKYEAKPEKVLASSASISLHGSALSLRVRWASSDIVWQVVIMSLLGEP